PRTLCLTVAFAALRPRNVAGLLNVARVRGYRGAGYRGPVRSARPNPRLTSTAAANAQKTTDGRKPLAPVVTIVPAVNTTGPTKNAAPRRTKTIAALFAASSPIPERAGAA